MAYRVTPSELRKVIELPGETDQATEATLDSFIETANLLVNELLVDSGLSDDRKKLIEKYLAAHFFSLSTEQGGLVKEQVGDASRSYNMMTKNLGLNFTRFGQQVLVFDTTGKLGAAGSSRPPAMFQVV